RGGPRLPVRGGIRRGAVRRGRPVRSGRARHEVAGPAVDRGDRGRRYEALIGPVEIGWVVGRCTPGARSTVIAATDAPVASSGTCTTATPLLGLKVTAGTGLFPLKNHSSYTWPGGGEGIPAATT